MTFQAVLYGPEGFLSGFEVAVDERPYGFEMRLDLPVSVDRLLMQVAPDTCTVRGELVRVSSVDVMNSHEIYISESLTAEVLDQELEVPRRFHKDILLGEDGCMFRNDAGPRKHGSLSGLLPCSMLRLLGEPRLSGDWIDFVDGTRSWLPDIRDLNGSTEVVLPSRVVTFGEGAAFSQWSDAA